MTSARPQVRRKSERLPLNASAVVKRYQSGRRIRAQLCDLSDVGCKMISQEAVGMGTQLLIKMPGLEFWTATVAWRQGEVAGLQFQKPLHPAVVEHLAKHFEAEIR